MASAPTPRNRDAFQVDLFLLDLKSWDRETHVSLTGHSNEPVLRFARRLDTARRPTWVRFVLVPGVTDAESNVLGLARFCATLHNLQRVRGRMPGKH